ncbi:thiolase-like protein [Delphinella strobiligena]|nr:thiolase-like protein [Delphinella strobiligena]
MEHAGIVPGRTPSTREDRLGVFYGMTSNDWCEANSGQDIDLYYIPGTNRAFIPGRINCSGPSYAIDTACSSSLSAVHIACNSLWQGNIDTAIAGGTNRLEDAIEDGDMIHGILRSAYTNHSAEAESTRPHVGAQRDMLERVLNDSGTHPNEVSYIEMHGTGTQAGDTREITSVYAAWLLHNTCNVEWLWSM